MADTTEAQSFILLDALQRGEPSADGRIVRGQPPRELRLFRAGANPTRKGTFIFDDAAAQSVQERAKDWGVRLSIDYAHASLQGDQANDPSKSGISAGLFVPEVRNGELWATDIRWTEAAYSAVSQGEWPYVSPVFSHTSDKHITELLNMALTGMPATKNASPLVALSVATDSPPQEKSTMDKAFVTALGLPEAASDAEAMVKLAAVQSIVATLSDLTGQPVSRDALAQVAAWKAGAEHATKLAADLAEREKATVAAMIEDACATGKLPPAQRAWATQLAASNPELLRTYLASVVPVVDLSGKGKTPNGRTASETTGVLSALERKTCRDLGIKEVDFIAARDAHSGATIAPGVDDKDGE